MCWFFRLKYRLNILKRAVAKELNASDTMKNMSAMLVQLFRDAVTAAFPDLPDPACPIALASKLGDYQFNGAMVIAGQLKEFTQHELLKIVCLNHCSFINFCFISMNLS